MSENNTPVSPPQAPSKKRLISKQARNYIIYGVLIAAVTGLTLYYLFKENAAAVIDTIASSRLLPVLGIVGLVVLAMCFAGVILTTITRLYNKKYHVYHGVVNGLIGSFFSNITPFASGGQFVQVYTFTRQGVKAAHAASILVMHFIIYQSALLVYGIVAFTAGIDVISHMGSADIFGLKIPPIAISIVGFVINSFTIVSLFVLAYCRPLHRVILNGGIDLLAKLHLIKNPEQKRKNMTAQVATFRIEFRRLMSNYKVLLAVFILILMKMTCSYSLPYFAGMATGVDMTGKYLDCLWSSSYLAMITSFIPIPGGSGGAEWGFQTLFITIYGSQSVTAACNILWRGISYYLVTLIGGLVFVIYRGKPKVTTEKVADTQTFLDLNLTSFLHGNTESTYEMLDRRYAKFDERKRVKDQVLTNDEVLERFKKMGAELENFEGERVGDTSDTAELTKKYLKIVNDETELIEKNEHDEEIEKAIKDDQDRLKVLQSAKARKKECKKGKKRDTSGEPR